MIFTIKYFVFENFEKSEIYHITALVVTCGTL